MAERKFVKGSEEWQFFQDFYKFCQKYWEVETADAYWDGLTEEAEKLYKKYKDDFCKSQLLAFLDYLEKKGTTK